MKIRGLVMDSRPQIVVYLEGVCLVALLGCVVFALVLQHRSVAAACGHLNHKKDIKDHVGSLQK